MKKRILIFIIIITLIFNLTLSSSSKKVEASTLIAGLTFGEILIDLAASVAATYLVWDVVNDANYKTQLNEVAEEYLELHGEELESEQYNVSSAIKYNNLVVYDGGLSSQGGNNKLGDSNFLGIAATSKVTKAINDILTDHRVVQRVQDLLTELSYCKVSARSSYDLPESNLLYWNSYLVDNFQNIESTVFVYQMKYALTRPEFLDDYDRYFDFSDKKLIGYLDYSNDSDYRYIFLYQQENDSNIPTFVDYSSSQWLGYKFFPENSDEIPNFCHNYVNGVTYTTEQFNAYYSDSLSSRSPIIAIEYLCSKNSFSDYTLDIVHSGDKFFPSIITSLPADNPFKLYLDSKQDYNFFSSVDRGPSYNSLKYSLYYDSKTQKFYNNYNANKLYDSNSNPIPVGNGHVVNDVYINSDSDSKSYQDTVNDALKKINPKSKSNPNLDINEIPDNEIVEIPYYTIESINEFQNSIPEVQVDPDSANHSESVSDLINNNVVSYIPAPNVITGPVAAPDPAPDPAPDDPDNPSDEDNSTSTDPKNYMNPDLTDIFPFCIPFDFADIVSSLKAEPKAPVIRIPCYTINKDYSLKRVNDIECDLSALDLAAKIFRIFMLIAFVIGLIFSTSKLVGGGKS